MKRILMIDDDKDWLVMLARMLRKAEYEVEALIDANSLLSMAPEQRPDLVITDIMMPGISGAQVHSMLRGQFGNQIPIVVCSSTKLRFRIEDARLAYCEKFDAYTQLVPLVASMLETSEAIFGEIDLPQGASQRGQA